MLISCQKIKKTKTFHYIKKICCKDKNTEQGLGTDYDFSFISTTVNPKLTDTQRYSKAVQISLEVRIKLYYKNIRQKKLKGKYFKYRNQSL